MPSLKVDPATLDELARRTAAMATDYVASLDERPIMPQATGVDIHARLGGPVPEQGLGPQAFDALPGIADDSRASNGRFFGYVHGPGEPVAALGDLYASVLNQNVTAWRSAPAAVTIERTVVGWLAELIGCSGFSGSMTGGGSMGMLLGLAMARESRAPAARTGARPYVVYASSEVHMAARKAVAILGIGLDNLHSIPVDDAFRMRVDDLREAIDEDRRQGLLPIGVVGSAGTINTGAIDPLDEIAAVAAAEDLWFHVDGAYGALAAMAVPERFVGLGSADSVALDAHKWLYQPLDASVFLHRDPALAHRTFAFVDDYAQSLSVDPIEGFMFFEETIELSRRFRALKVWLSLRYHGAAAFREAIAENIRQAVALGARVDEEPELERLAPVGLSTVCFRWVGDRTTDLDERNRALLQRLVARGRVYLSNATLRDQFALRACIVNPRTTDDHLDAVVEEVLTAARSIDEAAPA
jgi:glutamate/tyrosine decarboxylase-like PLP-dependent enzyme